MSRRSLSFTIRTGLILTLLVLAPSGSLAQSGSVQLFLPALSQTYDYSFTCPEPPTLSAPAHGLTDVSLAPLYQWSSGQVQGADYLIVEVSAEPDFSPTVNSLYWSNSSGPGEFRFPNNLQPGVTHYWRAYYRCGERAGPATPTWTFVTAATGTLPAAPDLVAPANGSVIGGGPITLEWATVPDAEEYVVKWRTPQDGGGYAFFFTPATQMTITYVSASTYEWWVTARSAYGLGPESPTWTFTNTVATQSDGPLTAPQPTVWFADGVWSQTR